MKPTIVLLFSSLAVALAAPPKTELMQVHKVYLLPMTNGMEQYLANRLTGLGVFQVVTDPQKADAVFTDGIGAAFESRQAEWFPQRPVKQESEETAPAAQPEAAAAAQAPVAAAAGQATAAVAAGQPAMAAPAGQAPAAANQPTPTQPAAGVMLAPVPAAASPAPAAAPQPKVAANEPEKKEATAGGAVGGERTTPVSAFHRAKGTLFLVDPRSRMVLWSIYAQPKDASSVELDRTAAFIASRIRQDLRGH